MKTVKKYLTVLLSMLAASLGATGCSAENGGAAILPVIAIIIAVLLLIAAAILFVENRKLRVRHKERQQMLAATLNAMPDIMFSKETSGAYTGCNPSYEKYTGLSEQELVGKTPLELGILPADVAANLTETDRKVLADREVVKERTWLRYPDGREKFVETIKAPIIKDGKVCGLLGTIRDITELNDAIEKAERSSKVKSEFLEKMSHEIRTPLNAIIGMAELALREEMSDVVHEHVITVKQAGINLLSIVNDILDFSKIESGGMEILSANYMLSSLINDVISIIRMRTVHSKVRFAVDLDSALPCELIGDETKIRQILINLLGNAVKYTEKGHVAFSLGGRLIDENTINIEAKISDTGIGIKPEDMDNLFGEYVQLDTAKISSEEGVGLGLTITKGLVDSMRGKIAVESVYGEGSTFTVTFPQKIGKPDKLAEVADPGAIKTILYERRKVYADSMINTLNNLGVDCEHADSNTEFFKKLAKKNFSYVFGSSELLMKYKEAVSKISKSSRVVLLAEFGEAVYPGDWSVLAMPAHVISVANIFNRVSDRFEYNEKGETSSRFYAPEAKVLVVDDINTNLKVAKGLLLPYGMQIELSNGGAEAIEAVKSREFDMVFMDHRMPGIDGVEAVERIRAMGKQDSYFSELPIVALTANAVSGVREMFIEKGFSDFMPKPIDTVVLNATLNKWIPKQKQKNSSNSDGVPMSVENESFEDLAIVVAGLNAAKGIRLSGGSRDAYFETLASFLEDGHERIAKIRECLLESDLPLYTTYVHALKSALAYIGADDLSETAFTLETAGQRGELPLIEYTNEYFLSALEQMLGAIESALRSHIKEKGGLSHESDSGQFKHMLSVLKTALEQLDAGTMNRTVGVLHKSAAPDDLATVKRISRHILVAEYDEAVALIDELLGKKWTNQN